MKKINKNTKKYEIVLKSAAQIPAAKQPFQIEATDSKQANRLAMKMMGFTVKMIRSKKQKDLNGQTYLFQDLK